MLEPRAGDEQENENNDEPLFGLGENEDIEQAFHRCA
jgi:hypothetical protein